MPISKICTSFSSCGRRSSSISCRLAISASRSLTSMNVCSIRCRSSSTSLLPTCACVHVGHVRVSWGQGVRLYRRQRDESSAICAHASTAGGLEKDSRPFAARGQDSSLQSAASACAPQRVPPATFGLHPLPAPNAGSACSPPRASCNPLSLPRLCRRSSADPPCSRRKPRAQNLCPPD